MLFSLIPVFVFLFFVSSNKKRCYNEKAHFCVDYLNLLKLLNIIEVDAYF